KPLDFNDGQALDARLDEGLMDLVQLEWFDDRGDQFHVEFLLLEWHVSKSNIHANSCQCLEVVVCVRGAGQSLAVHALSRCRDAPIRCKSRGASWCTCPRGVAPIPGRGMHARR